MSTSSPPQTTDRGIPVVEVFIAEELDAAAVPRIRPVLEGVLAVQPDLVVVDLSGCPLIDAAGISLLLDVHRRRWVSDGRLVLRSPTAQVRRVLEIARVAKIMHIETTPPRPEGAR
jgi:anti-anti-sigma factor